MTAVASQAQAPKAGPRALLVTGTGSDVGKSVLVAGICRWLARQGVRVAPFKAQNMALNSFVTLQGAEIGRAQAFQAYAAGREPEAAMNPVLLKPTGNHRSQVIVLGSPHSTVDAAGYQLLRPTLAGIVNDALADLRSRYDVVICEGAGSPAEINLRAGDLVNMGLARAAGLPTLVVADIERGGALASLLGTMGALEPQDQALIAGFIINKFRGNPSILQPGLVEVSRRSGRPVLGVVPWRAGLQGEAEDSLALGGTTATALGETPRPAHGSERRGSNPEEDESGDDGILIAVIQFPHLSNFTDLDALAAEPGVQVRFTTSAAEIRAADLLILPGTKTTVADLGWLRAHRLDHAIAARARRGDPILGLCGGYQVLGLRICDTVESTTGDVQALGLLPITTRFHADKHCGRPSGTAWDTGHRVHGYQVRHGRIQRLGGAPLLRVDAGPVEPSGDLPEGEEGCQVGAILGTSWHGLLENDEWRRDLLGWVQERRGIRSLRPLISFSAARGAHVDLLADLIDEHLDTQALCRLLTHGIERPLSTITMNQSIISYPQDSTTPVAPAKAHT